MGNKAKVCICSYCKKEYVRNSNSQKFCSKLCANKSVYWEKGGRERQIAERDGKAMEKNGKIQCQVCKKWYRQVGSHIVQVHGITAREYREAYGFDVKRGQLPEDLRGLKARQVFENGTVENLKKGAEHRFNVIGKIPKYKRSEQTMERLSRLGKKYGKRNIEYALKSIGKKRKGVEI